MTKDEKIEKIVKTKLGLKRINWFNLFIRGYSIKIARSLVIPKANEVVVIYRFGKLIYWVRL